MELYYIYILSNRSKNIYVGVTNNIYNVIMEHKGFVESRNGSTGRKGAFSKLVYYEKKSTYRSALKRCRQIEGWGKTQRISLIESVNPDWLDVSSIWLTDNMNIFL